MRLSHPHYDTQIEVYSHAPRCLRGDTSISPRPIRFSSTIQSLGYRKLKPQASSRYVFHLSYGSAKNVKDSLSETASSTTVLVLTTSFTTVACRLILIQYPNIYFLLQPYRKKLKYIYHINDKPLYGVSLVIYISFSDSNQK